MIKEKNNFDYIKLRKLYTVIVVALLFVSMLPAINNSFFRPNSSIVKAGIIYVDTNPGGSNNSTIQKAIDNATDGDIIIINETFCNESFTIDANITLTNASGVRPIIDVLGGTIQINNCSVTIENMTIFNSTTCLINVSNTVENLTISNCTINSTGLARRGINISRVVNLTLYHNTFLFNGSDESISFNPLSTSVFSRDVTITNNYFIKNGSHINPDAICAMDLGSIINGLINYNIFNSSIRLWIDPDANNISSNLTISNNTFNGASFEILAESASISGSADNVTVKHNNFTAGGGVLLKNVSTNVTNSYNLDNISVTQNNFFNDTCYVNNSVLGFELEADSNWWNTTSGPTYSQNQYNQSSQGAIILGDGDVDFFMWLNAPYPGGTPFMPVMQPSSFTATVVNSSAVNLTFTKGWCADTVYIEKNTDSNWERTGSSIYDDSGSFYVDDGLNPESTYYYQAWGYNETANSYSYLNASTSAQTSQSGIFINGTVVNFSNHDQYISNATVCLMKMDMGPGDDEPMADEEGGDDMGDYFEFTNSTDENGYFEVNLTDGGQGQYELWIMKDGYASYMNWSVNFEEDEYKEMGTIPLPMIFSEGNEATIKGYIENDSTFDADGVGSLEGAEIMLLNTNFNYMIKMEGMMEDEMMKNTTTNETGYFTINANFPSNYSIIAFKDGYYANISETFEVTTGNQVNWSNMTLDPAEPDDLTVILNFTDLDDVTVTVNRTIRAESPVFRFSLDVNPEIGNNNGVVSSTEASDYLDFLSETGPGFMLGEEENEGPPEEGEEDMGGGGPDFLALPLEILLDGSTLDSYVTGSHNGTIDNIIDTNAGDNSSIYYNATFNITLDGKILDDVEHTFNITTEHNNTFNTTLTIIYKDFYNITGNASTVNVTLTNTTSNLTIIPGENDTLDAFAYANITLELNQTSYSTPIIEVPTWNITDWWQFNKTGSGPLAEQKYTVIGKPLRRWDRDQYYMGDEETRYLCYKLYESNDSYSRSNYVTINDVQWLSMQNDNIILSNDLDFPLYGGKTWSAITWWGEQAVASVSSTEDNKFTENDTYSCVHITYTNQSGVCGEQWYSPTLKFFVNRTQNISGSTNITWNLTEFSHGPFIEEVTIGNVTDESTGLIECLYANLTINVTNFYDGPSSYMLDGCLFKENFDGPPEDIMWVWDTSNSLGDISRSTDPIYVNITYDGGIINASNVSGLYTGQLEMRKDNYDGSNDGYWIDTVDYYSFESNYNATDFISPAVTVVNSEAFGNGTEGSYNHLTLNATLLSADGGTYRIHAGLEKIFDRGGWQDWRWITGTGTDNFILEPNNETNVTLNFPGQEIYDKGYPGPYHIHLEIENVSTNTFVYQDDWYIAHEYNYDDFASPSVFFNKTWFSNYSYATHDYLNASTFLTINTSITVTEDSGIGDYGLCGSIHIGNLSNEDELGRFIAGTCNDQISLSLGENLVPMNFDLGEVQDRLSQEPGDDHTLKVDLSLSERVGDWIGPEIDYINYYTQNYSMNDLPDPPISLDAFSDEVTGGNLNISLYINITSDEYTNQTYELHGGVHHNQTSDGHWMFITGNWTEISIDGPGSYTEYFHFSGMEIGGCGENGPYNIWLGLDKLPDYQMVADDEYDTTDYTYDQFATPDVQFNDSNTSAEIWGEENFAVNVSLLVDTSGTYHIGGGIHYVEHMDGWDEWRFLDGFGQNYPLNGNTNLTFNFSQSIIKSNLPSDYNGPLVINMGIENTSNWQHIDHLDWETPDDYTQNSFSGSSVVINSTSVDRNGNDLRLNISYDASDAVSGNDYNVFGGLHDDTWWYITGDWKGGISLSPGNGNNVSLNFSGSDIFGSQINPTKIWFGIEKVDGYNYQMIANKELHIVGYTYDQFSSSKDVSIIRNNMGDGNADYIHTVGSKPYLTVDVSINVTSGDSGTYWIDGGIDYVENDNYHFITGKGKEQYLSVGNHTIPLNFSATDIKNSGYFGEYKVWLSIRDPSNNWEDKDNYEYTTQQYSSGDFPAASITIVDKAEGSTDIAYIDGDQFIVNVTINVSSENNGEYDLHGGVNYQTNEGWWQHITGAGDWVDLEDGQNNETLIFNAGEIKNKLPSGSRNLSIWIGINDIDDWEEITHNEYITKEYSQNDFPGPKMTVTGNDDSVWGENYTVNLTLTASNDDYFNNLEIHGGLNYIDDSNGWDEWRFITGFHQEVSLSSNGTISCNFSGGDIYTELETIEGSTRLIAWIAVENTTTWTKLAHIEYESGQEYSSSDFSAPSLTLNCTGDFYNDTVGVEFLQVNVSLNKTDGFAGNTQAYEIHSGIHYIDTSNDWEEWRFITGFNRQITPTENITIPLNFSGTALYESGQTGPFEVWVGLSRLGQWDDIAHYEYTTTSNYSDENFSAPPIEINDSDISDYVNDNGDLQINVSVRRPSDDGPMGEEPEYEYILEGCIHWKQGHQWKWISWTETPFNDTDYDADEYNISLNFSGQELKKAAEKGWTGQQLVAWFSIRDTETWAEVSRVDEYETQNSYGPSDFSDAPVTFNRSQYVAEELINTTGDGAPYDYLNITVPLNITDGTSGNYKIFAGLFDGANNTFVVGKSKEIVLSSDSVVLNFSGEKINRNRCNITEFRAKIFDEDNNLECDHYANSTSQTFVYTDFVEKAPEASIGSNYSNTTDGSDNLVIQVNISITENNNRFKLYGDIFDNTSSTFITKAKNVSYFDNVTGNVTVNLTFSKTDIDNSEISTPYKLAFLELSILNAADGVWEPLDTKINPYWTREGYHTGQEE